MSRPVDVLAVQPQRAVESSLHQPRSCVATAALAAAAQCDHLVGFLPSVEHVPVCGAHPVAALTASVRRWTVSQWHILLLSLLSFSVLGISLTGVFSFSLLTCRCRPLQPDDHAEEEVLVDSQGTALSTSADFEVPAAVTSNDCWEAAFRVERMKKISVEVRQERTIRAQQVKIFCFLLFYRL